MNDPYQILRAPIVTEKTSLAGEEGRLVCFEVHSKARKHEIRLAVETAFPGVKVDKVRTISMKGKLRRLGRNIGRRPDWKKAYITLAKDSKTIEFFES